MAYVEGLDQLIETDDDDNENSNNKNNDNNSDSKTINSNYDFNDNALNDDVGSTSLKSQAISNRTVGQTSSQPLYNSFFNGGKCDLKTCNCTKMKSWTDRSESNLNATVSHSHVTFGQTNPDSSSNRSSPLPSDVSDGSFLNGGKCDLKTKKCTRGSKRGSYNTLTTFLGIFTGRQSFVSTRPGSIHQGRATREGRTLNSNVDDVPPDEGLLVRLANWLDDYKFGLLIGGGAAVAAYFVVSNETFSKLGFGGKKQLSACEFCQSCKMRNKTVRY